MIASTDIGDILYAASKNLGIPRYQLGNIPSGTVSSDRMVIVRPKLQEEKYWNKAYPYINIEVPDINGKADITKLQYYERQAYRLFDDIVGEYDGTSYYYSVDTIGIEDGTDLKCHYVSVRILFEILNY